MQKDHGIEPVIYLIDVQYKMDEHCPTQGSLDPRKRVAIIIAAREYVD
jgi:hypothetical protein